MPDQETNANEGADPTDDIKKQNETPTRADDIAEDDPHKAEKLAGFGKPDGTEAVSE